MLLVLTSAPVLGCTADSEDQNSVTAPEKPAEPQYAEVQIRQADPSPGQTDPIY